VGVGVVWHWEGGTEKKIKKIKKKIKNLYRGS